MSKWLFIPALVAAALLITRFDLVKRKQTRQEAAYGHCVDEMNKQTCRMVYGPEPAIAKAPVETFLIAGAGEVSRSLYRDLVQRGPSMCEVMESPCDSVKTPELCRLAVDLFAIDL